MSLLARVPAIRRGIARPLFASAALAAALLAASTPVQAQTVDVSGFINPGPINEYFLFVSYDNPGNPTDTLALVTVDVPAVPDAITNLDPPSGFLMFFDAAFGTLDLAEDAEVATPQTFAAGTTQGAFRFRSTFDLTGATFTALDSENVLTGTITLTTLATPEPSTFGLLALSLVAGAGFITARRRR